MTSKYQPPPTTHKTTGRHEPLTLMPTPSLSTVQLEIDVAQVFKHIVSENPGMSAPVAAIKALVELIKHSKATTMSEFIETLKVASRVLKESTRHPISVSAGCDLFMRFVTVTSHDHSEFQTCKEYLIQSGNFVVEKASSQKQMIVDLAQDFIKDGCSLLIHSYSRVVMQLLVAAAKKNKRFTVFATESRPSNSGYRVAEQLRQEDIPVTVILDSAVGYIMEKVDMVLVGAEGVVENGGLINQIGTYQIALVAKAARKPFYAAAESFKFVRLFPLNQYDLPHHKPSTLSLAPEYTTASKGRSLSQQSLLGDTCPAEVHVPRSVVASMASLPEIPVPISQSKPCGPQAGLDGIVAGGEFPAVDYTPPEFITLLLTDLGVLTPSGVSDELIKLYY